MTTETKIPEFEGWAVVEIMGHKRLAGYVREVAVFGTPMLRIDIPGEEATSATQYYGGGAIYCVTPCAETIARAMTTRIRETPEAVAFALPAPKRCELAYDFSTPCSPDFKMWSPPEDGTGDLRDVEACGRHLLERTLAELEDEKKPEAAGFTRGPSGAFDPDDLSDPRD